MTMQGQVSLEWGLVGAMAHGPVDFAVVVDVLSFTTSVAVAAERGIEVLPYPWTPPAPSSTPSTTVRPWRSVARRPGRCRSRPH